MTTPNNERKPHGPLQVGLIADAPRLALLAPALQACPVLQVAAQAGMAQRDAIPEVAWVDDTRLLLAQPGLQAVLLATSTRHDAEFSLLVAERQYPIWQLPPLGRNFAEATEAVTRVKRYAAVQRFASWWEHVAEHVLDEAGGWPEDFTPRYSEIRLGTRGPTLDAWTSSLNESAGGVLANEAYFLLEALVATRGLPESVVAVTACHRPGPPGPTRETEDIAVAILRYADGGTAAIRAAWDHPPFEKSLSHYGQKIAVTLTTDGLTVTDVDGSLVDRRPFAADWLQSELQHFADFVRGDARDRAAAALERHVAVSALLETIYLAARTGHPESPYRRYEVLGWPEPRA